MRIEAVKTEICNNIFVAKLILLHEYPSLDMNNLTNSGIAAETSVRE